MPTAFNLTSQVPAQPAPAGPEPAREPAVSPFKPGDLVRHEWDSPQGRQAAYGRVIQVLHDDGADDRVRLEWLDLSHGIPVGELTAAAELAQGPQATPTSGAPTTPALVEDPVATAQSAPAAPTPGPGSGPAPTS